MALEFQRTELRSRGKGEIEFVIIQNLKDDDLLAIAFEQLQGLQNRVHVPKAIGQEEHQTATFAMIEERLQNEAQVGFLSRLGSSQDFEKRLQMVGSAARRDRLPDLRVEGGKSDGVLLIDEHVSDTGSQSDRVLMFRDTAGARAGVLHRAALIQSNGASQACFIFVLPNVQAVGFAKQLPIDGPGLISGDVGSVLFELDARTDVMRSMESTADPFHDTLCQQLQAGDPREIGCC